MQGRDKTGKAQRMDHQSSTRGTALLTPQEVADRLKVSLRQIYYLVDAGELPPPFKIGRQNRWREQDLTSYLDRLAHIALTTEEAA
jgi:excisionase family DNA binding protein